MSVQWRVEYDKRSFNFTATTAINEHVGVNSFLQRRNLLQATTSVERAVVT